jgi:predicted RNA-binding Zn-ribbon protein involved in translation (DUF1610 family)
MKTEKMCVIIKSLAANMAVIKAAPNVETPVLGEGDTNYICGNCGNIILKNVIKGQIKNIVFECPTCGEYNMP